VFVAKDPSHDLPVALDAVEELAPDAVDQPDGAKGKTEKNHHFFRCRKAGARRGLFEKQAENGWK
jgi:hypothetical protein